MNKLSIVLAMSLMLVGCADYPEPTPTSVADAPPASPAITTVSTLTIVAPKSVVHGTNPSIAATVIDDSGRPADVTHKVTWSSSNLLVLTVSDGRLYTIGPGTATVRASYGEETTSFDVTVVAKSVVYVAMMADSESAPVGETRAWSLMAHYNDDSVVDVTDDAAWSSSDDAVATLDAPGIVRAAGAGMATIIAAYGGQRTAAPFLVQ